MNFFVFFLIWALVWSIPIPPWKAKWKKRYRIITFLLGLFIFFIIQFFRPPLSIFTYLLAFIRLLFAFFESAFSIRRASSEELEKSYYSYRRIPLKISAKEGARILGIFFIVYLVAASTLMVYGQIQRVANASYFNGFI